ncbi:MAG: chromosome segregation protein SMC, partial [Planctomycetes bacterium RBG_13_63_9]
MLKALELAGFKSFADKTRFEFPSGITVVVGPNGSGKSNIVDAIKWVLGEQSVKSLRGKEMADVIFNGSGTRRGMNSAEITLTFENSNHLLAIDTPEVHITRRVYRNGEGEYLINRQPGRLRDIRDLLAGTGMGTQAYSVIEQGKVDVLLQSSPVDRRVIFEEAAGISRFKARKIESLRRLERVEQNLLRLCDIVEEVEGRLRSIRLQAGKARRYKEHTDRLQELRTQVGLVQWRRLSDRLAVFQSELGRLGDESAAMVARAETVEVHLLEMDNRISEANEAIRESEARIATNRERIAANESTIEHERARSRDLEQEIARHRHQLVRMNVRAGDLRRQLQETSEAVRAAEEEHRQIAVRLVEGERELTGVINELDQLRGENEQRRAAYMEQMRAAAALGNQSSALESQVRAAAAACARARTQTADVDRQIDLLTATLEELRENRQSLQQRADEHQRYLAAAEAQLGQYEQQRAATQQELAELRRRHNGATERASLLEELQRRQEGLSPGVKEVLAQAGSATSGPLRCVRGLLADLLHVSVEIAPLVEVALGPTAQHVVVGPGTELRQHLAAEPYRFAGRLGFVWMDAGAAGPSMRDVDLEGRPGVLGRADRFVKTDPDYAGLARRLLAGTWIVEKLSHAMALAESVGGGLSFVTLAGELLAGDGTLVVGPRHGSTGLISRRSELRALQGQLAELHHRVEQAEQADGSLKQQISRQQQQVQTHRVEHRQALDLLAEERYKTASADAQRTQFDERRVVLQAELRAAETQHEATSQELAESQARRKQLESGLAEAETELTRLAEQIDRLEGELRQRNQQTTQTKVELAKNEERLRNLQGRLRQYEESGQERRRAISDSREQLARCADRAGRSRRSILSAEAQVAELYLRKEAFAARTVELIDYRESLRTERTDLTAEAQTIRGKVRQTEEMIHAQDLAASEVRHERDALAARLREDYEIELAELEHEPTAEEQLRREEVQEEIDELR